MILLYIHEDGYNQNDRLTVLVRMGEIGSLCTAGGNANGAMALENSLKDPPKDKHRVHMTQQFHC
jgi:hypothetical protein